MFDHQDTETILAAITAIQDAYTLTRAAWLILDRARREDDDPDSRDDDE